MDPEEQDEATQTTDPDPQGATETEGGGDSGPRLEETLADAGSEMEEIAAPDEAEEVEASEGEAPGAEAESESAPSPEETPEEGEGEHAPEYVRWSADGDPDGSYRDAQGRLHDAESGEFLQGETKDPPDYVKEVAEADEEITPEEAEDFFEGEDVEPIEFEHDGEEMELAVEDEEARQVLEDRLERAERAEELESEVEELREERADVQELQAELNGVLEGIQEDPSSFIMQNLQASKETKTDLARDLLLLDDEVFEEVASEIENWRVNPSKREVAKAKRERDMAKREAEHVTGRSRRSRAKEIHQRIDRMVPDDLDRGSPERLKDRVVMEIERAMQEDETLADRITAENFTDIEGVRELLGVYGVDPSAAPARANGDEPEGDSSEVVEADPAGEQEAELAERAEAARRYGVMLRKKRERREDAATTPSGAGASPKSGEMPDGATLDEAIEEADRRIG